MRIIHRDRATDDAKTFVEKACRILSVLLSNDVPEENKFVGEFLNWLISRITPSAQEVKQGVAPARATQLLFKAASLKDMLKRPENQVIFMDRKGLDAIKAMIELESQNTQLVYLLGFCVWLLTFNKECVKGIKESQIVSSLTRILRISVREKVIRICFASLKNLVNYGKEGGFEEDMIGLDVPKLAQTCLARNFKDKDIEEDIKVIEKKLDRAIEELSSWELYVAEVRGGQLRKGAVHTETFFKENNMKFEGNGFEIVKKLITLLPTSLEEGEEKEEKKYSFEQKGAEEDLAKLKDESLEMALFDLGEFARVYPRGKSLIEDFKGKNRIMFAMGHHNPRVKKAALLCVQKMMVQNWEFLSKTGAGKDKEKQKQDQ
jgi:V-type H+-transporting ATPase subunit H